MALYKLHDFDPNYRDNFNDEDVKGLDVYSRNNDDKVGSVHDILVDEDGRFRYLIIDTGFWVFGKKVMLPIGLSQIDYNAHRVYVNLTREQAENLPEFNEDLKLDRKYEDDVRTIYQPSAAASVVDTTTPLNTSYATPAASLDAPLSATTSDVSLMGDTTDRDYYTTYQDAGLYDVNERDHRSLRLYEERLVTDKQRVKTGEVAVGKRVETETQRVSVPVEKERVVIERVDGDLEVATPGAADFQEGEVARMEVYEEVADIRKEPVVRETVQVRKEVNQESVDTEETLRREELDVKTDGNPVIDRRA